MVTPIEEGDKVKAEIISILYKDQIKYIKNEKLWPEGFEKQEDPVEKGIGKLDINKGEEGEEGDNSDSDPEDDSDLFQNTNRPVYEASDEESDSEDE